MFDLAILGGGPAGYVAAEKAASAGLRTVLFEKNELGGVCLNEGCIPTKALLYCAKLYEHASSSARFGVTSEAAGFDFASMMNRKDRVVRRLVGGVKARVRAAGVTVVKGEAAIKEKGVIECCGQEYPYGRLLICTGSSAAVPPIPGLRESAAFMTNREALSLAERPESLVVIGGGVIGMEFAGFFNSLGTKVTVIEALPEILGGLDDEISAMLRGIYSKKGVEFRLGCKVTSVDGHRVGYVDPEGAKLSAGGDRILVSVGRRPNLEGFGLERLGVATDRGIKVDSHMRTSAEGVYAAGDVTGFSLLAHTASREAEVAVNDILGIGDQMSYDAIPGVVYTNPEVAGVGLSERQAAERGIGYKVWKLPMAYSGRYVAENENIEGICKILTDSGGKVLGAHMLGSPCSEIIQSFCLAITNGLGLDEIRRTVFPHPSVAEIIKETISDSIAR